MSRFLWVCLGGALGTGARYLLTGWAARTFGPTFPVGTLAVNALGSFLLAAIMHLGLNTQSISPTVRIVLGTGVMGGFTTYSTFNYETMQYLQEGAWGMGLLNVSATVAVCLLAGMLGLAAARFLAGG